MSDAARKRDTRAELLREAARLRSQAERLVKLAAEVGGAQDSAANDQEIEDEVIRRLTISGDI
jgi:hypothetical protein